MIELKQAMSEYERYLSDDNCLSAPAVVREKNNALHAAFDEYVSAVTEFEWCCGYIYAVQKLSGGAQV